MKTIVSVLIAGAASFSFIGGAHADNSTGASLTRDSIAADYKSAQDNCKSMSGYDKSVCLEQAKATRAHAEADWAAGNNQTASTVTRANNAVAKADYALAKAKCKNLSGADKTTCMDDAKSARTIALNNTSTANQVATMGDTSSTTLAATNANNTNTNNNINAANTADGATTMRCDSLTGTDRANCMASGTDTSSDNKVADALITTKVKADLIKEPNLKSMEIHVQTMQGTVQLSGFVGSDADAARAADLARGVKGVKAVQNDIKIK